MERFIIQDGITYRIVNDILKGWIGQSPFQKPILNGTFDAIIEGWTAQDELDRIKAEAEQDAINLENIRTENGKDYAIKLVAYIKLLGLDAGQLETARQLLKPVRKELIQGEWEDAKVLIDAITRPAGQFGVVYDRIKAKIDNYEFLNQ